jgi:glycosyltransferase involved in cell wall biosynthesis/GT2 family glycosyltransferase
MPVANQEAVLSVVIGSYNRLSLLHACIQSICESSIPIKIYVTDAGSKDGSVQYLQSLDSHQVTCIFHTEKIGQAKAYNEVFSQITTKYTCWLSDDNIVINNSLAMAVSILEQDIKIGMVALKVRDMQGPFANEPYIGGISSCGILNVNQGLLRTKLLQELGGFSEAFMDYGIDPDLTARVLFSGNDIVYTRRIALHHWRDWGTDTQLEKQLNKQEQYQMLYRETFSRYQTKPQKYLLKRYYRTIGRLLKRAPGMQNNLLLKSLLRDINNILSCAYISPYDPILCAGRLFYLRQSLHGYKMQKIPVDTDRVHNSADLSQDSDPSRSNKSVGNSNVTVAINAQLLEGSAGGIETNLLQLLRALSLKNQPGDTQLLIGPGAASAWLKVHLSSTQSIVEWSPIRYVPESAIGSFIRILRKLNHIHGNWIKDANASRSGVKKLELVLRTNGVDIIHFPYQRYFPTSLPFIFEPWDLQHIYLPEMFSKEEIRFRDLHYKEACQRASVVVTATRSSKYDIVRHFQIPASKVAVIYRGVDSSEKTSMQRGSDKRSQVEPLSIEDTAYAIYPAKPWPHKNHERLFAALAKLRNESGLRIPVVCTGRAVKGRERFLEDLAIRYNIADQIVCTGYLSECNIKHYLENARLLIFPSLFEGLGIPLLEAMDWGVPITCSNVSCIPEVVGKSALMFNPYSVDDIAAKVSNAWLDDSLRKDLAQKGKDRAKDFSWNQAAGSFLLVYRYVAGRSLSTSEKLELQKIFS